MLRQDPFEVNPPIYDGIRDHPNVFTKNIMHKTIKIEDKIRVDYRDIYEELNIPLAGSIDSDFNQEDFEEH